MDGISREQTEHGRMYTEDGQQVPSVTNVLGLLDEDTSGLEWWKEQNDGQGNNADHEHLFWYKRHRGTLAHAAVLDPLADRPLWGTDEHSSLEAIERHTNDVDRIYSVVKDHEVWDMEEWPALPLWRAEHGSDGLADLTDVLRLDVNFARSAFAAVREALGITRDAVRDVERYVLHSDVGYGGQVDLVYDDGDSTVVADLKTSSGLRHKHRLQTVAYAHALPYEVDRTEVIRVHPDSQTWHVHSPVNASEHHDTDYWFSGQYSDVAYEDEQDMWETFTALAEQHPTNSTNAE
jgi:hypothetical protein